jgi:endonuclease III
MTGPPLTLSWVVETLDRAFGPPRKPVSRDPFRLILYEQVGYLASEPVRRAAYRRLEKEVGLTATAILQAPAGALEAITRAGGAIAAPLRATRLRKSAELVRRKWDGDLNKALALPLNQARRALAEFPMIGKPGADRILAETGAYPVFGPDSNGLRVLVRLGFATEQRSYDATYRAVQIAVGTQLGTSAAWLATAQEQIRRLGQEVCRRSTPLCDVCPLALRCAHIA